MISRLWDHRVVVYEEVPDQRDVLQSVVQVWRVLPGVAGRNARPDQNWAGRLQDRGPGEAQEAMRRWFLDKGMTVAERNILRVESGPEAPLLLLVESVTRPTAPLRVHHLEVSVSVWDGSLGDLVPEESS